MNRPITTLTRKVQVYLDESQIDRLHQIRRPLRRSLSNLVRVAVDEFLAREAAPGRRHRPSAN